MISKEGYIKDIVKDIFSLESPKIKKEREQEIAEFIDVAVNGDAIDSHLTIGSNSDDKHYVCVYVLTNKRLIQIEINIEVEIKSTVFLLTDITGVERKLLSPERMEIRVIFKNDLVGLRYPKEDRKATEFFQQIEQIWVDGV